MKIKKSIDRMSIPEIMQKFPHCSPMNDESIIKALEHGETSVWMNPHEQTCFNYGSFTVEDFRDWAKGTGKIVKGRNQEEKDKFMFYAKKRSELDYSIFSYWEHLHLLESDYNPNIHNLGEDWIDTTTEDEVIAKVLSAFVPRIVGELERGVDIRSIRREMSEIGWGIKKTLILLGYGCHEANNRPETLRNLAWSIDLVFAKAYHTHLINSNISIPDITFVHRNTYQD